MKGSFQFLAYALPLLALTIQIATADAEFNCQSEISYKWKLDKPENSKKEEKVQQTPVPQAPEVDQEVFYSSVAVNGSDEAIARSLLAPRILDSRAAALRKCQDEHQNVGRCFSVKLTGAATILNTASFSARKLLEQSMMEDCKSVSGRCGEVLSSEPKCAEKIVAPVGSPVAEEPKGGKKDEKKKK